MFPEIVFSISQGKQPVNMNTTTDSDGRMVKAAPIMEADLLESFVDNQDSDFRYSKKYVSSLNLVRMEADNVVH